MTERKKYELSVVSGVEGACAVLNNYRIAGPKPWGGGQVTKAWRVTAADLLNAVPELVVDERARIREALEAWVSQKGANHEGYPGADKVTLIDADDLLGALDLIFQEGEHPTPLAEAEGPADTSAPAPRS